MLSSPLLEQTGGYIHGRWSGAVSGGTLDVVDPATGDRLAEVPNMGAGETREAVASAAAAMQTVSSLAQRRGWLKSIAGLLMAEQEELARLITLENGKTLTDSLAEISYAAAFFTACSDNLQFLEPEVLGLVAMEHVLMALK